MKILSCYIENFGVLKNVEIKFNDKISTFLRGNGEGKTTLAVFLKAMFYGMSAKLRNKEFAVDRSRYSPFSGGNYGGNITFSARGKTYILVRYFGATPEKDMFELYDAESKLKSKDFSSNIGEEIFGVGVETFTATAFFGEDKLSLFVNDEMRAGLSGLKDNAFDMESQTRAVDKLNKLVRQYKNEMPKDSELVELNAQITRLSSDTMANTNEAERLSGEIECITQSLDSKRKMQTSLSEKLNSVNDLVAKKQALIYNYKIEEAENDNKFEDTRKNNFTIFNKIFLCLSVLIAFLVILFGCLKNYILMAVFVILLVVSCYFAFFYKKVERGKSRKSGSYSFKKAKKDDKNTFFEQEIIEIDNKIKANLNQTYEEAVALSKELNDNITLLDKNLAIKMQALSDLKARIESLQIALDENQDKNENLIQKRKEVQAKIDMVLKAIDFMNEAKNEISTKFVNPVNKIFQAKYSQIISESLTIDSNLEVKFQVGATLKEGEFLSKGLNSIVLICKRLALIDLIYVHGEKPFIVLDDPFISLDNEKLEKVKNVIKNLAENFQIIYLTCSKERAIS